MLRSRRIQRKLYGISNRLGHVLNIRLRPLPPGCSLHDLPQVQGMCAAIYCETWETVKTVENRSENCRETNENCENREIDRNAYLYTDPDAPNTVFRDRSWIQDSKAT